jgi:DNA-directed RNA polymerase II subunit RPB4
LFPLALRALEEQSFQKEDNGTTVEVKLSQYEIASLANMAPEAVEEATALIPSLQEKFEEHEIEQILEVLKQQQSHMFA